MSKSTNPRKLVLPTSWPRGVRSALLHVVSLAQYAAVYTRSWASESRNARVRLKADKDQFLQEVALLRAEIRLKDARMACLPALRRPQGARPFPSTDSATAGFSFALCHYRVYADSYPAMTSDRSRHGLRLTSWCRRSPTTEPSLMTTKRLRGRPPAEKRRCQVAQLRSEGLSLRQIGERLGVSKQAVASLLNYTGDEAEHLHDDGHVVRPSSARK
jgi:hypothetical protein